MTNRKVPFDVDSLARRSTSGLCFICEFLRGNPDYTHIQVGATDTAIAFLNKYPTLFGYVIVAPREHREQVTGDFTEGEYVDVQRFIYRVAEGVRRVLSPERIYILSLGSQAANSHVHWHIAPLPSGVPLELQQYHALMHENGAIAVSDREQLEFAQQLEKTIGEVP